MAATRAVLVHVDAFTERPFRGNPAAVCLLDAMPPGDWMRAVAREMNLSETAFVVPRGEGFSLRWFTPAVEVDLCGHATLAAAHVVWERGLIPPDDPARFHTRSGLLEARRNGGGIWLDFPAIAWTPEPVADAIIDALRVAPRTTGMCGPRCLIEVDHEAALRALRPDFALMRSVPGRAVIVTSLADAAHGYDIVSRYFAPWVGVDEDPVTGVAHCALAPYWAPRLGRTEFVAFQASARGGDLRVRLVGSRVELGGQAVTVAVGHLLA